MKALPDILSGCKVFPCIPLGKDPATTTGWKEASNDPAQIKRWQRINPDFNWAVATGLSGLFVLDVDPNGLDWWTKLLERNPVIKAAADRTYQVRTPRGGLHIYFRGEGPSTASRIADGIDTRGGIMRAGKIVSGGYVLLPGSRTSAGSYSALPGGEILDLPSCITALVPERKKTDTLGLDKNPLHDQPRNIAWATDLLKNFVASGRVAREGAGGDNLTFQVCAAVMDKGISPGVCYDLLQQYWNPHCHPPWDEWELEIKIKNALAHGEDTESGAKGFQANADAFAAFAGLDVPDPAVLVAERNRRDRLQWIHDYADSVGDPEWLIPDILPKQGVVMLYGESGSYKSFISLDLALCVSFGIPGQWNAPTEKGDVLFFAGESPIGMAKLRWPAWMEQHDQEFRTDHRMIFKDRVPFFNDVEEWENIKQDLNDLKAKPSLIVFDTLSRLMTSMDENTTKDATVVMHFLEELARYYECCVLFIHHTGKDASRGARGSIVYYSNADAVIALKKMQTGAEMKMRKQKESDTDDAVIYFKVKPSAKSIVLVKTTEKLVEVAGDKKAKPAADWMRVEEIVPLLPVAPQHTSTSFLAQTISGKTGVELGMVVRLISNADHLKFLRNGNKWQLPQPGMEQEFDL